MILSPKARFQVTPDAKRLTEIAQADWFLNAVTAALAEMQMTMPGTGNPAQVWDAHCQMAGAKAFLYTLLNLSEPVVVPTPPISKNLREPEGDRTKTFHKP